MDTRRQAERSLHFPGTLVQGPDSLLDLRIADYQEPPTLHVSAARGADTRFQDLSDQFAHVVVILLQHTLRRTFQASLHFFLIMEITLSLIVCYCSVSFQ